MRRTLEDIFQKVKKEYLILKALKPDHELLSYGKVHLNGKFSFADESSLLKFAYRFRLTDEEASTLANLGGYPIFKTALLSKFYQNYYDVLGNAIVEFVREN